MNEFKNEQIMPMKIVSNKKRSLDVILRIVSWFAWFGVVIGMTSFSFLKEFREISDSYILVFLFVYFGCISGIDKIDILNKKSEPGGMSKAAFIVNLIFIVLLVTTIIFGAMFDNDILLDLLLLAILGYIIILDLKAILAFGKKNAPSTDGA